MCRFAPFDFYAEWHQCGGPSPPSNGVLMVSIACEERTEFWAHLKKITVFGHFTPEARKIVGKNLLGHVPINRSHKMDKHFLPQEVTVCEINTQMFRNMDIFLFNVPK